MKSDTDVKMTIGLGIVIFLITAFINPPGSIFSVISMISSTISITALARWLFVKWIWKWIPFWVHGVPVLEGEWNGIYKSNGNDRTPEERKTGNVHVSILQPNIFTTKLIRHSDESMSESFCEHLKVENGIIELLYSYRSEPNANVRERSQISYGTARLKTPSNQATRLDGDYWTDQKTTGTFTLKKDR